MSSTRSAVVVALFCGLLMGGCSSLPKPSEPFPAEKEQVKAEWERMGADPVTLDRPVVIIDGWVPTGGGHLLAGGIRELTGQGKDVVVLKTNFLFGSAETAARATVKLVEKRWPSDDPNWTREVDVIGFSNGGVYARLAALPPRLGGDRKQLKIKRLFTINSPHRGVRFGIGRIPIDAAVWDVLPGSKNLAYLDEHLPDAPYELLCYAEVNDEMVGAKNAAPPGQGTYWTYSNRWLSHIPSGSNKRILADISLRLRGEPPMAAEPSEPPKQ